MSKPLGLGASLFLLKNSHSLLRDKADMGKFSSYFKNDPICQKGGDGKGPWGFDVADYAYHYNGKVYQKAGKNK